MDFSLPTIFISYSRQDGRAFSEAFEKRLEAEAGIRSWRDLKSVEGGEDIRPQVLRAIEEVKHFVLILSRRALVSDWVKREWTHARAVGRKVSPVLADPSIKRSDLPAWIRRADVYDIAEPERWAMLVQVLRGPGEIRRVPYMSGGPLPYGFVPRPAEYGALKTAVLSAKSEGTVALTTALRGAGGYGKTTLANALCQDSDVRFEFSDGILRVEVGKERDDVTGLVVDLIEKLDPEAQRPGFRDVRTAAEHLGEVIGEARLLLVIDDVWREAQLRPFLTGGPNCVRLVTTRLPQVLRDVEYEEISIDEMRAAEAASLISAGLPVGGNPAAYSRLTVLANRLGCWAQMLGIANGWLRDRLRIGEPLSMAIDRFERRLAKQGLVAFDRKDETDRNRAIRACVEASLEDLSGDEIKRLGELAILPEDEDVPLGVVEALWAKSGELDEDDSDDLIERFFALSLLQSLNLGKRTLRLHDNMVWYLRDRTGPEGCRAAHDAMVTAIHAACDGNWPSLPAHHAYGWRFLIWHLRGAGWFVEANRLLTDYIWIKAKLAASGAQSLFADYLPESSEHDVQLIGRAIGLALPTLMVNPRELSLQLFGRLGNVEDQTVATLIAAAQEDVNFCPTPRWSGLTPPGTERLRLVGHESAVTSATFCPKGSHIVTTSLDGTARLWDAATGVEVATFRGEKGKVVSTAFSPDGNYVVTASDDGTARVWDSATGAEIAMLRKHLISMARAATSPDGNYVISVPSYGDTAQLWNFATGVSITTFRGYAYNTSGAKQYGLSLTDAAFSPDGRHAVMSCSDMVLLWDITTNAVVAELHGHERHVHSVAYSPDGSRIVSASGDGTARIWDATTGIEIVALRGHESSVRSAAFSPDGSRVVTTADDCTARLWEAATGAEVGTFRGHEHRVEGAAFSPDGSSIVTASWDHTVRLWDAIPRMNAATFPGHEHAVNSIAFFSGGGRVVTASDDGTARIWNAATGGEVAVLYGHWKRVLSAVPSPDGCRVVTASEDGTTRLWDVVTGAQVANFRGKEDSASSAVFSPNGDRILTLYTCAARLWDIANGSEISTFRHSTKITSVAFSPDGSRVVTTSMDLTARIWDAATGVELVALCGHEDVVSSAAFSPDGSNVVTAAHDGTARIWDAVTGAEVATFFGHEHGVISAVFSPDGDSVVTASWDGTARLWDATTGDEVAVFRGHMRGYRGTINSTVFSPNGNSVVTASEDGTVRVWETGTGREVARITLDAAVTAFAIHSDLIALGDFFGRIHVYEAKRFMMKKDWQHG